MPATEPYFVPPHFHRYVKVSGFGIVPDGAPSVSDWFELTIVPRVTEAAREWIGGHHCVHRFGGQLVPPDRRRWEFELEYVQVAASIKMRCDTCGQKHYIAEGDGYDDDLLTQAANGIAAGRASTPVANGSSVAEDEGEA